MAIYLDAIWVMNFFFDFMLLLVTDRLAKLNSKRKRLALGAFVASCIVPLTVLYPDSFFTTVIGKVLFSMLIILTAFGFGHFYRSLKLLSLFYFINFSIGGGLIAFHNLLQTPNFISGAGLSPDKGDYGDPISWLFVIVGFPLALLFTKRRMDKHTQDKIRFDSLYSVVIQMKNVAYPTTGYIDSGNQLTSPLTKKPVIICDELFLRQWFAKSDWEQLKKAYENWEMEHIPKAWIDDLQVIPYQGVAGKNGFVFALKPDLLTIHYEERTIETGHFLIGIQFGELTNDGRYHCLLQPELIQGQQAYSA